MASNSPGARAFGFVDAQIVIDRIASGGVDYVKTLGHIEPWAADMDAAKEAVINGSIILEIYPVPPRTLVGDLVND